MDAEINYNVPCIMCVCASEPPYLILAKYMCVQCPLFLCRLSHAVVMVVAMVVAILAATPLATDQLAGARAQVGSAAVASAAVASVVVAVGFRLVPLGPAPAPPPVSWKYLLASPSVRLHIRWLEYEAFNSLYYTYVMYSAHTYRVWWHQQKVNLTHNLMYTYTCCTPSDDTIVLH